MSDNRNTNKGKGWGGPFDFNGDGKTTWSEESFGLMLANQSRKNNSSSYRTPSDKARETGKWPTLKPVPEIVDENNYDSLISYYRNECYLDIVAFVILLMPAILFLWLLFSVGELDDSTAEFFIIAGLIYGGLCLYVTGKSFSASQNSIELVKERYSASAVRNSKKK